MFFVCRRTRRVADAARRQVEWNRFVCQRVLSLNAYLERPHSMYSWPARLLPWRPRLLMQRRAQVQDSGAPGGRAGTRTTSGHAQTRWHDGASNAEVWFAASEAGVGWRECRKALRAAMPDTRGEQVYSCVVSVAISAWHGRRADRAIARRARMRSPFGPRLPHCDDLSKLAVACCQMWPRGLPERRFLLARSPLPHGHHSARCSRWALRRSSSNTTRSCRYTCGATWTGWRRRVFPASSRSRPRLSRLPLSRDCMPMHHECRRTTSSQLCSFTKSKIPLPEYL